MLKLGKYSEKAANYGTRKIKMELGKNLIVSRRRIERIMKEEGLISVTQ